MTANTAGSSAQRTPRVSRRSRLRLLGQLLLIAFFLPLATHAAWWLSQDHPRSYAVADWSSADILPRPAAEPEAVVHVLAGRTGRWKGIFAHHTWVVVKPKRASRYTRYEVVGWGQPVRTDSYAADGRWFGDTPVIVATLRGAEAERAIPDVRAAVASYPYGDRGTYGIWPGPNSNTFIAHVVRAVPDLAGGLLPTAIGKDFQSWSHVLALSPSRTGLQLSLHGLLGVSVGWVEGIELNILGLVAGIDVRRPAVKLPGWGRIGLPPL